MSFEILPISIIEARSSNQLASPNFEIIQFNFIDSGATNQTVEPILNAPPTGISNVEILGLNFIESLRFDFLSILQTQGICPLPLPPIIVPIGYIPPQSSANLTSVLSGLYFRVPVDIATTVQNQTIPKYLNSFEFPIGTFVYPITSVYSNLMIVKSNAFIGNLPSDVVPITNDEAVADLLTYANEIFVF